MNLIKKNHILIILVITINSFTLMSCVETIKKKEQWTYQTKQPQERTKKIQRKTYNVSHQKIIKQVQHPKKLIQRSNNSKQNQKTFNTTRHKNKNFIRWVQQDSSGMRKKRVLQYQTYIYNRAGYVPPIDQLLLSARSWRSCGFSQYSIPPKKHWSKMVETVNLLNLLRSNGYLPKDFRIVSVYRNPALNRCAKGSKKSKHMLNSAVDIRIDYENIDHKKRIVNKLCDFWYNNGYQYNMGLGIYKTGSIHIDTQGHRTWGSSHVSKSSQCLIK